MHRLTTAIIALGLSSAPALAQVVPLQGGAWTPGHSPMYLGNGSTQPVMQDSGPASGGGPGLGLAEQLLVARGIGLAQPPYQNAGSGPGGANWCDYDGPTTGPYHYFCISPNTNGQPSIAVGAGGGATVQPLQLFYNGQTYQFPFNTAILGAAVGGDLVGTLPNPTVGPGAITSSKLAAGAAASNIGTVGGDLVGNLPSPKVVAFNGAPLGSAFGGDFTCTSVYPLSCTVASTGGVKFAAVATSPFSTNLNYSSPYPGAGTISQQQKNAQTVNIDEFPQNGIAPGSGTSDDTAAANAALSAVEASNGVVQLSCNKTYYFAGVVNVIGATLRQCITAPNNIYDKTPIGFPGSTITGGHIILGPNAYFNMARGGGVRNAVVVASWVTSMINPDFSQFVGTAFLQGSGGLGDGVFMDDVIALGFAKCYDGTNGGFHVEMHHFVCDAINGEIIGPAADTDKLDDISNGPYLTASFPGYNVTSFSASNGTVTLSYTGPVMVQGGRVQVKNDATLGGNYTAFITAATGSSSPTSASTVSFTNPTTSDVTLGQVLDYNRALLRSGGGTEGLEFLPGVNSDDIRVGRYLDFGHDICADFQSNGNVSGDHLWCDNNNTYGVRNVGSFNVHITDLDASTDNVGIASFYRSGSRPSMRIEHANVTATFGDCTEPAGNFSIGYLECLNIGTQGSGYAVDSSDGTALIQINSGVATSLASGLIASGGTLDELDIHLLWTNPPSPAAGSIFGGNAPTLPILPVSTAGNGTINLSPNIKISKINVSSNIGTIGNGYDGREYTLICTAACVFYNQNGLPGAEITLKGGVSTATGPGVFKFVFSQNAQTWYQE